MLAKTPYNILSTDNALTGIQNTVALGEIFAIIPHVLIFPLGV